MYLTQQTDYALRVLMYAAVNNEGLVNIAAIAQTYGISKSHLMKVVTLLVKGGFLASVRGKGGGLKLAQPPEHIRVGEVVRVCEPMPLVECFGENNRCLITESCRLSSILQGGLKAFLNHLDGFTVADLINKPTHDILYSPRIPIAVEDA